MCVDEKAAIPVLSEVHEMDDRKNSPEASMCRCTFHFMFVNEQVVFLKQIYAATVSGSAETNTCASWIFREKWDKIISCM